MRAAQSKGIADLLVLWPVMFPGSNHIIYPPPWLVQCKYSVKGGGYLPAHEEIELAALAEQTGAIPVFARPGKNGRGVEFINLSTKEQL